VVGFAVDAKGVGHAIGNFLFPNITRLGEDAEPGTWGDYGMGLLKGAWNTADGLSRLAGGPTAWLTPDYLHVDISSQEVSGAATFEGVAALIPASRLGRAAAVADDAVPLIKAGSAGGETAGKSFSQAIKDAAKAENPLNICVYCRREGVATQVDHSIPKSRGGNATLDNAQLACPHCNASKGARDFPVNPPPGYRGEWPPAHWGQ
jgi:hypothetical protein